MPSKRSRSSARSMPSAEVPSMRTPWLSKHLASFTAVCPPKATTTPTGCSQAMTLKTSSSVSGSK